MEGVVEVLNTSKAENVCTFINHQAAQAHLNSFFMLVRSISTQYSDTVRSGRLLIHLNSKDKTN